MQLSNNAILDQIDVVISRISDAEYVENEELDVYDSIDYSGLLMLVADTVKRLSPSDSYFLTTLNHIKLDQPKDSISRLLSVLHELRFAYKSNLLSSVQKLVQADLFSDLLEGAKYLLDENWKDAAAVMIGGIFEQSLRKLAQNNSIDIVNPNGSPKKSDTLNQELCKASVYNMLMQKSITAMLDLRNNAAHGKYNEYYKNQVHAFYEFVIKFNIDYLS